MLQERLSGYQFYLKPLDFSQNVIIIGNMTDAMQQTKLSLQYDLQLRKTCALIGLEPQKTIGITMRNGFS